MGWFRRRKKARSELPLYAAIVTVPTRGLPEGLQARECSDAFETTWQQVHDSLLTPERRPAEDDPFFSSLMTADGRGVVTMPLPESGGACLPVFSSPLRAVDYRETLLSGEMPTQLLVSSVQESTTMLQDLRAHGIERFAIDRCPRCETFSTLDSAGIASVDDVFKCWSIHKATELSRVETYLAFAHEQLEAGESEAARDVMLETVAHVTMEDPRPHLLLGRVALSLGDRKLFAEAHAFLGFLGLEEWQARLDQLRDGAH